MKRWIWEYMKFTYDVVDEEGNAVNFDTRLEAEEYLAEQEDE